MSDPQIPAYAIRSRISPSPGSGVAISSSVIRILPLIVRAFMKALPCIVVAWVSETASGTNSGARRQGLGGGGSHSIGNDQFRVVRDPISEFGVSGEIVGEESAVHHRSDVSTSAVRLRGDLCEAPPRRILHRVCDGSRYEPCRGRHTTDPGRDSQRKMLGKNALVEEAEGRFRDALQKLSRSIRSDLRRLVAE